MKFYISASGIKRVTISKSAAAAKPRRIWSRRSAVLPVVLMLAVLSPFLFLRIAFLVLESPTSCSSFLDCLGWRFFSGSDTSMKLGDELTRALQEAKDGKNDEDGSLQSFNELVKEMTSSRQDIKAFAFKTKAMLLRMEHNVQLAKQKESIYWHLASHGVPKSLHCFCLKLAEEYAVNALARARLPSPDHVFRLIDPSFHHVVLLTDNVLAASVVISSTIHHSVNPKKLVFHIVTDKKTYTSMHAWFATNPIRPAGVEVKGLHQYYWSEEVNVGVKEMMDIHRLTCSRYHEKLDTLEPLSPSCLSLMNHLRIYIPELFPDLRRIVFLDDDVVVQQDISSLWEMDLNGKIIGAVVDSWCGDNCCPGRKYKDYLNFSQPIISSNFDHQRCAWLYGMNVFDLEAWRRSNITASYHHWLKHSLKSGFKLWQPGALPPALVAFEGQVHPIDPSWHVAGLGHRKPDVPKQVLDSAAVIHFSGPAKPWMEIGLAGARNLWSQHVNSSNKFIRKCKAAGADALSPVHGRVAPCHVVTRNGNRGCGIVVASALKESTAHFSFEDPSEVMEFLESPVRWKKRDDIKMLYNQRYIKFLIS